LASSALSASASCGECPIEAVTSTISTPGCSGEATVSQRSSPSGTSFLQLQAEDVAVERQRLVPGRRRSMKVVGELEGHAVNARAVGEARLLHSCRIGGRAATTALATQAGTVDSTARWSRAR
jgi:hypothetical protein